MSAGKIRLLSGLALAICLVGVLGQSAVVQAQDSTDAGKRSVKSKVAPQYPALARQMNVVGKVKIEVTISIEGQVKGTRVVGGSPLLVNAAVDAVKKWRFEPAAHETTEVIEFEFKGM